MVDLANIGSGALSGAGLGSAFAPGIGTAFGALGGGLLGLFGAGKAKKDKVKFYNPYTPEQQSLINEAATAAKAGNQNAIQFLNSILSDDPEAFSDFEHPLMEQFEQQTTPNILERLNMGDNKYSGAVTQQLAQAGRGLSSDIAALRARLKQQAVQDMINYSNLGLTQQQSPYIKQGKPSAWGQFSGNVQQGAQALGSTDWQRALSNFSNRFRGGI